MAHRYADQFTSAMQGFDWGRKTAGELMSAYEINKANEEEDAKREPALTDEQKKENLRRMRALSDNAPTGFGAGFNSGRSDTTPTSGAPATVPDVEPISTTSIPTVISGAPPEGMTEPPPQPAAEDAATAPYAGVPQQSLPNQSSAPETSAAPTSPDLIVKGEGKPVELTRDERVARHNRDAGIYTRYGLLDRARDLETRAQSIATAGQQEEINKRVLAEHDAKAAQLAAFNAPWAAHDELVKSVSAAKPGDFGPLVAGYNSLNTGTQAELVEGGVKFTTKDGKSQILPLNDPRLAGATDTLIKASKERALEAAMTSSPEMRIKWEALKASSDQKQAMIDMKQYIADLAAAVKMSQQPAAGGTTGTGKGKGGVSENGIKYATHDDFAKAHLDPQTGKQDSERADQAFLTYQQLQALNPALAKSAPGEAASRFLANQYANGKIQATPEIGADGRWGYYLVSSSGNKYLLDKPEFGIDPTSIKGADGKPRVDAAAAAKFESDFLSTLATRSPEYYRELAPLVVDDNKWSNILATYNAAKAGQIQMAPGDIADLRSRIAAGNIIRRASAKQKTMASDATPSGRPIYTEQQLAEAKSRGIAPPTPTAGPGDVVSSMIDGVKGIGSAVSTGIKGFHAESFDKGISLWRGGRRDWQVASTLYTAAKGNPDVLNELTPEERNDIAVASGKPPL